MLEYHIECNLVDLSNSEIKNINGGDIGEVTEVIVDAIGWFFGTLAKASEKFGHNNQGTVGAHL
jgi:hypothetical protein